MFDKPVYLETTHPKDIERLENLTMSKNWDSEQFDKVLVALGLIGNGQAIPGRHRPDSIHLQKYRKHFEELLKRTKETGKEYARVVFFDSESKSIVMSNKISVGTNTAVTMHIIPQPGREMFQKLIGSVHTHPIASGLDFGAHGLSGTDYKSFLSDPKQQFMIITYGDSVRMLVLKTSVTPNNMTRERIEKRIFDTKTELISHRNISITEIINFNKTICTEFGLTFYMANKESNDLFTRINVVN